jgi:hypothetical protein
MNIKPNKIDVVRVSKKHKVKPLSVQTTIPPLLDVSFDEQNIFDGI